MPHPRFVSTLRLPDGGFARGTRGAAAFAEEALREAERGADELALLEPPGADRRTFLAALERTAAAVRIPVLALAAVEEVDDLRALLEAGADRVDPGPGIVATPSLLEACAARAGSPRLLAELTVRRRTGDEGTAPRIPAWARERTELHVGAGDFEVLGAGRVGTGLAALGWAAEAVRRGAGELLIAGLPWGADVSLVRTLTRVVRVPIAARVAGAGAAEVRSLLVEGGAHAIHVGGQQEAPRALRRALAALGVPA